MDEMREADNSIHQITERELEQKKSGGSFQDGELLAVLHSDIGDGYQGESISTNTDQEHDSQTEYQNTSQDLIYLRFHSRTVDVVAAIH